MGLLDKLKNVFFEEEYVEEEIKETPVKKQEKVKGKGDVAKKIEVPKKEVKEIPLPVIEEEPIVEVAEEPVKKPLADRELLKPDTSFRFYEEDDFVDEEVKVETISTPPIDRVKEKPVLYGGETQVDYGNISNLYKAEVKEKSFRPTPIISPIYGILDKNYSKEDIIDKKERRTTSSYVRKIDLDSVRKKAYGELSYDLGLGEESPVEESAIDEIEDNLLYDMSETTTTPVVEKVTLADAEEYFEDLGLEYNIDYKDKAQEKVSGRRVRQTPIDDILEEEDEVEEVTVIEETDKKDEEKALEDNLFDLIDSMYEDKE